MTEARIKAGLWVRAALRAMATQGLVATVARKGDEDAGAVLLKQNFLDGRFRVLSRVRDLDGRVLWRGGASTDEVAADAAIAREIVRDCDLWVVEIEDREGRLPFDETLEKDLP